MVRDEIIISVGKVNKCFNGLVVELVYTQGLSLCAERIESSNLSRPTKYNAVEANPDRQGTSNALISWFESSRRLQNMLRYQH